MDHNSQLMILLGMFIIVIALPTAAILSNLAYLLPIFLIFYSAISFGYIFSKYMLGIIDYPLHYIRHRKVRYEPSVSVIIPCFNENSRDFSECIKSVCDADYPRKEVIIVDDGSTKKEVWETVKAMSRKYRFRAYRLSKNMGKKSAMALGFRKACGEIVITVDSDSLIKSGDSIRELVKPMADKKVGAVCGCIMVENRRKNVLTKMQDARYWMAFFIEKAAENPYNSITCASGPFSAYRKSYLMQYLDDWENEIFMGVRCTYGDDRELTTRMLKSGYDVKFARDAVAFTNVPESAGTFIRQQIRWMKSFIKESWSISKFITRKNIMMKLDFVIFWTVFTTGFVAKLLAISLVASGMMPLLNYILMLIFVSSVQYLYMFIRNPGTMGYYGILYGLFNEFVLSWLFFYAFANLRDTKWGTR